MIRIAIGFILATIIIGSTVGFTADTDPGKIVQALRSDPEKLELRAVRQQRDKARADRTRLRRGLLKLRRVVNARVQRGDVMLGLRCIQGYEGSWRDPNAPYWGGLQADMDFMRTYAAPLLSRLGTAENWPPIAQLSMGVIAYYSGRGFGPWPNTRRMCGL